VSKGYDQGVLAGSRLSAEASERLDRLFRLYNARLFDFAATRTRDVAAAEDVTSETWLRAAVSLPQLRADDSRAYGWLRAIAVRAAIDYYRPRRASEEPRDWTDPVSSRSLPAAAPADGDALVLVDLSVSQCTAFKLAAQGLSQGAIASRMGRSPGAVYSHLHRGARKLRTSMAHDRDGRQPTPQPTRPRSRASVALAG
jgi:RNA polymerase sigma factor (sigma-70 family)